MKHLHRTLVASSLIAAPSVAHAAGGVPPTIDYFTMILDRFHFNHQWLPTVGAVFALALVTLVGLRYRASVASAGGDVSPDGRFSLRYMVESILDFVHGIAKDNCGEHYRKYVPFLASLFIFILISNLTGLVPGFPPATLSMDTNVALGLMSFAVYNYAGLKEHGAGYVKTFLGPVVFIAPLFLVIELISHASRPLSLGLRLMGNIYGDHTLVGVFTSLTKLVFPAFLLFFGLLVAVVQSFIFTLLTGIYIALAISHDH